MFTKATWIQFVASVPIHIVDKAKDKKQEQVKTMHGDSKEYHNKNP